MDATLAPVHPERPRPHLSTITGILHRHDLSDPRAEAPQAFPRFEQAASNARW